MCMQNGLLCSGQSWRGVSSPVSRLLSATYPHLAAVQPHLHSSGPSRDYNANREPSADAKRKARLLNVATGTWIRSIVSL